MISCVPLLGTLWACCQILQKNADGNLGDNLTIYFDGDLSHELSLGHACSNRVVCRDSKHFFVDRNVFVD